MEQPEIVDEELDINQILANQPKDILIKNDFYLYSEINVDTAKNFILNITNLAIEIIETSLKTGMGICPINIHICSPGGEISSAITMVEFIKRVKKGKVGAIDKFLIPFEVNTFIEGEADSAASLIASVGSKRFCSKNSLSLIHNVRQLGGVGGKAKDIQEEAENLKMVEDNFKQIYLEHSKLTEEELDEIFKHEKYYTPEQLLEFGLIDEIVRD